MSSPPRSPTELLARFDRQLLVDGVDLSAQQRLADWSAVVETDGSEVAEQASSVLLSYIAGSGFKAVQGPGAEGAAAVDEKVAALGIDHEALPPVAHFYLASRKYGASFDVVATTNASGWSEGRSRNARVCTCALDFGRPAELLDAPFLGAAAADLLLSHLLDLAPMPAIARYELHDGAEPQLVTEPGRDMVSKKERPFTGRIHAEPLGFSLQSLAAAPAELVKILDDCRDRYPNEACGFVIEQDGRLQTVVCDNLQDRYHELDPTTYRRTARTAFKLNELKIARALEAGGKLVCIYHSHCDAGAYFSDEDVECALLDGEPMYPGVQYLVVSVYGGALRACELYDFDPEIGTYAPATHPSQTELARVRQTYRQAVREKSSGAWTWDLASNVMRFDPALKAQLGYTDDEIRDEADSWFSRLLPADGKRLRAELRKLLKGTVPLVQEEVRVQHRDGSYLWARVTAALEKSIGEKGVVTGTQEDITATKLAELRLSYVEQHDHLTGLLNADPFVQQLEELAQSDTEGVLVICDLLEFGDVNKRFDRLTGDDTLIAVAGLLEDQLPEGALIGRLAGDLFGFVVPMPMNEALALAEQLRDEIGNEPFVARNGDSYTIAAQFAVGAPEPDSRYGRDWLDRVLCALKSEVPQGVVLVR